MKDTKTEERGAALRLGSKRKYRCYYVADQQIASRADAVKKEEANSNESQKEGQTQNQKMTETQVLRQTEIPEPETVAVTAQGASEWLARDPVAEIPYDQLGDFNFLLNQYYIVDASTSIDESLLDAEAFYRRISVSSKIPDRAADLDLPYTFPGRICRFHTRGRHDNDCGRRRLSDRTLRGNVWISGDT